MKKNIVRITLEIDQKLRAELKARAAKKYLTLKDWILCAVVEAIRNEQNEEQQPKCVK